MKAKRHKNSEIDVYNVFDLTEEQARLKGGKVLELWKNHQVEQKILNIVHHKDKPIIIKAELD